MKTLTDNISELHKLIQGSLDRDWNEYSDTFTDKVVNDLVVKLKTNKPITADEQSYLVNSVKKTKSLKEAIILLYTLIDALPGISEYREVLMQYVNIIKFIDYCTINKYDNGIRWAFCKHEKEEDITETKIQKLYKSAVEEFNLLTK